MVDRKWGKMNNGTITGNQKIKMKFFIKESGGFMAKNRKKIMIYISIFLLIMVVTIMTINHLKNPLRKSEEEIKNERLYSKFCISR